MQKGCKRKYFFNTFYKNNNSSAGTTYITFRSATKHNLVVGDFINLKYKTNDKDEYSDVKCKINLICLRQ